MDAIERIRDFATGGAGLRVPVRHGVATSARSFDASRRAKKAAPGGKTGVPLAGESDPSVEEMCRVVRAHGFVVRLDPAARQKGKPALKLFRFADRCHPAGIFDSFADLMGTLTGPSRAF